MTTKGTDNKRIRSQEGGTWTCTCQKTSWPRQSWWRREEGENEFGGGGKNQNQMWFLVTL